MRKIYILIFLIVNISVCWAQQHPSYTQYTLNRFALNPAVAGLKPCIETVFGNRREWSGFEGAPTTYFASIHTRFNKDDKFPKNFHGAGAYLSNDQHGFDSYLTLKLAYSYHIKLWKNYHLSVGIFGGIQRAKTDFNGIRIQNFGRDPVFDSDEANSFIVPEVSPGAFIYNRSFFMGLSFFQVYPARIKHIGTKENRLSPHLFYMGGYRFRGKNIHVTPSYLLSFSPVISPTLDLTLTVDYKQKISLALGSKYLNSGYATLQFNIAPSIVLGYSYEYALNEIAEVAPTSHEIVLRFNTCKQDNIKSKVLCPAYQ